MSSERILTHLRRFLLGLAAFLSFGTIVELILADHMASATQLIPFVLCGLGLVVTVMALVRPNRLTIRLVQAVMAISMVGSLFGIYEHLEGNWEFASEIQPNATLTTIVMKALSGANPLLAPGMLAFAALVALATTYYHPALRTFATTPTATTVEQVGTHA